MAFFVCPYKITFLQRILKFEGFLFEFFEKAAKRKGPHFREPYYFDFPNYFLGAVQVTSR